MPTADLCTLAEAKEKIGWDASFSSGEDDALNNMIDAVSEAIERYCRVGFSSTAYDELYDGTGHDRLILRQRPVIKVSRVCAAPTDVIQVRNTSSANQHARVRVNGTTGLELVHVASGVVTTTTTGLDFAGNVTLSALVTAVNAVGSGWAAQAVSPYSLYPSADLRSPQGGSDCAASRWAALRIHVDELSDYAIDLETGILTRESWNGWFGEYDFAEGGWPRGHEAFRVIYTAGYTSVPEDVRDAAALWVASLYAQRSHQDQLQATASNDTASGSSTAWFPSLPIPKPVVQLLAPHRKHTR